MGVCSLSLCFIIYPMTFIDITISMDQLSLSVCFIVSPLSFVSGTIRPKLCSYSISHVIEPLSIVSCTIFHCNWTFLDSSVSINVVIRFGSYLDILIQWFHLLLGTITILLSVVYLATYKKSKLVYQFKFLNFGFSHSQLIIKTSMLKEQRTEETFKFHNYC